VLPHTPSMASVFKAPKAPAAQQEDPAIKAMRDREQARAEGDRTNAIQDNLRLETRLRNRRFGLRSLLGPLGGTRARSLLGSS
jgi:hypothetical protein